MVLAVFGAVWLYVRGQHPYRGPTAADIPVLIAFIVLNFAATVAVRRRATAGVSGTIPVAPGARSPSWCWHGSPRSWPWRRWLPPG